MKKMILLLIIGLFNCLLYAQETNKSKGLKLLQAKNYAEAEAILIEAVKETPGDAQVFSFLASAQFNQSKYKEATETSKKGMEASKSEPQKNEPRYMIARCYLALNDSESALKYLDEMVKNGAGSSYPNRISTDKLFDAVRTSASLVTILDGMKKNSSPCMYEPNARKFDFWIGVWDVFVSGTGSKEYTYKVAVDSVVKSLGGCSLTEYFVMTPPSNFEGMSFTFYDVDAKKIRHNWAGSGGDIYNYEVIKMEENMVQLLATTSSGKLLNSLTQGKGGTLQRKFTITYLPAEMSIHQFIEVSVDQGKTWSADWDAMFKKRKS